MTFAASCKRAGVEPFAWFRSVLARVPHHPVGRNPAPQLETGRAFRPGLKPTLAQVPLPSLAARSAWVLTRLPRSQDRALSPPTVEGFTGSLRSARAFLKIGKMGMHFTQVGHPTPPPVVVQRGRLRRFS
jgi:hypothetical protein